MSRLTNTMFSEMRPTIDRGVYWQGKIGLPECLNSNRLDSKVF